MGENKIREILETSFRVETLAEKIYLDLSALFPEARALFEKLACEEARHADIVAINIKLLEVDALPPEFSIDLAPLIRDTISIASVLEAKIGTRAITLSEALDLSIAMEETGVEAYLQQIMHAESEHDALNYVKKFCKDSEFHADLIREFKEVLDLNRTGPGRPVSEEGVRPNCWEFMQCGRQPGGPHERDLGPCPASTDKRLDGVHHGVSAGRACWIVSGTLCRGRAEGIYAQKLSSCRTCGFYRRVREEECPAFQSSAELLARLGNP